MVASWTREEGSPPISVCASQLFSMRRESFVKEVLLEALRQRLGTNMAVLSQGMFAS